MVTRRACSERSTKGFTLIEIVIVLAIIGVLAGILAPMLKSYVEQAKMRRAEQDTKTLGEAMLAFNKDVARFPIFQNGNATTPGSAVFVVLKTEDGSAPAASVDSASWLSATADTVDNQLKKNTPGGVGAAYPTTGEFAWRGPYMGETRSDPWGSYYVCNATNLQAGNTNAVWVLSAGANKTVETTFNQARGTASLGGDDVGFRVK
jgi:general secretion pathway protein G